MIYLDIGPHDMKSLYARVELRDTGTPKGRGVFALQPFRKGEVIEVCPVVIFETPAEALPEVIDRLMFDWGVLANKPRTDALALGYGSLYNDDNPANMRYEAIPSEAVLRFIAVRDIAADEELTINYSARGGGATWHDDNWFDHQKVIPVRSAPRTAAPDARESESESS
jgi:SET domain-containing protein